MKFGVGGILNKSFLTLFLVACLSFAVLNMGVFANTHTSTVDVTPHIVPASANVQFIAHVECTVGPDPIHEFRVYEPLDFSGLSCDTVTGWYPPFYAYTTIGGVEYYFCQWIAKTGNELYVGDTEDFTFYLDTSHTECCRDLFVETRDDHGFYAFHNPGVCIDTSDPITTKSFIGPYKIGVGQEEGVEWIDGVTLIELIPTDPEPHPSGIDKTWYKNVLAKCEEPCWYPNDPQYCSAVGVPSPYDNPETAACIDYWQEECWDDNFWMKDFPSWEACVEYYVHADVNPYCGVDPDWHLYDGTPIQKPDESCHMLYFFSVDNVGNTEDVKVNCFFVDKTAPVGTKEVGEPNIPCNGVLILENKNPSTWKIIDDGTQATLEYNGIGPKFEYSLTATGLEPNTEYSLIYYADFDPRFENWGGNNPGALITTVTTDGSGNIGTSSGSTNLGMNLPSSPDWNINPDPNYCDNNNGFDDYDHCSGAKIWLVPSDLYDETTNSIKPYGWHPEEYLFETDLITYTFAELECDYWVRDDNSLPGTPITLTCVDPEPHPSGDEEVCFRVSYDLEPYDLTDLYCDEDLEYIEQPEHMGWWCCVLAPEVIIFEEDSLHDLEFFCRDAVDKKSEIDLEWFRVDSVPPEITKTMIGEDHLGYNAAGELDPEACPPRPGLGDTCYVRDDGLNGVKITVEDGGEICAVGVDKCYWGLHWFTDKETCINAGYRWDGSKCNIGGGDFSDEVDIFFTEDSTHELDIRCLDKLGNEIRDEEYFLVDSTPPITTKVYGEPYKADPECVARCEGNEECIHANCPQWITGGTPITITAKDAKVDVDKIYWADSLVPYDACWEPGQHCHPVDTSYNEEVGDTVTFYKGDEESCHVIQYYAVDKLGNGDERDLKWQCVFVDNTAPEGDKKVGDPKIGCDDEECEEFDWWVRDHVTPITLDCEDQGDHPVDQEWACFKISFDDPQTPWLTEQYCQEIQRDKEMVDDWCCVYVGDEPYTFTFKEDSLHDLEFYCMDHLGNREQTTDLEYFKVDSIPPTTTKTYIPDAYVDPTNGYKYIDTQHVIELTATDGGDICHVDGERIYYRYSLVNDEACEYSQKCQPMTGNYDWQFYFDSGSNGGWDYVLGPDVPPMGDGSAKFTLGDSATGVVLGNSNQMFRGIMLSGITELEYSTYVKSSSGPETIAFQINIDYDCTDGDTSWQGRLVYEPYWTETVEQDKWQTWNPLNGKWWASGTPGNVKCPHGSPCTWIEVLTYFPDACIRDADYTGILLKAGSGWSSGFEGYADKVVFNGMTFNFEETGPWSKIYSEPFGIPEESCHLIEFYSVDALGNEEDVKYQCVFVDKKEPKIEKTYGDPHFVRDENGYYAEYINKDTEIKLNVYDQDPHPSGVKEVWYRYKMVDDAYCEDVTEDQYPCEDASAEPKEWEKVYSGFDSITFKIPEESCHVIEVKAWDNVGKYSEHKQCVFVDNSAPEPDKKVGDPKSKWFGEDSYYYKDITGERCWKDETGSLIDTGTLEGDIEACRADPNCIECWRITLLTPIYLECKDPEPHPVDHETVCFYVERDGKDETEEYCSNGGELVYDDDYGKEFCCMENKEFNFGKTSEHELEYYCLDALENKGEKLDIEKFKVEETAFNITLNHKWNLISVPVFLLNDDPEAVFSEIEGKVKGVWTYDPEEKLCGDLWCFWSPELAGDNLENILPGWGYWVLMEDGAVLTIGGSLMRPGPVGMASKEIVPGWNLIGYYGADGETVYDEPDGDGGEAYCELYSLGEDIWDKEFTGLWTYWEPADNPYQWIEYARYDNMDPGAGYWLATPHEGLYTPTTSCGLGDLF